MNGSAQLRETAADGITELLKMCDPSVLKPVLIKTTGPLIRVAGDRFPSAVKSAILQTLSVLLDKGGAQLKAFAPQLQTTLAIFFLFTFEIFICFKFVSIYKCIICR
jgi:hypothetical protein